jgi:hypothetical protein
MPVAGFATFVNAFAVSGGTPAKSFTDYVAWVKAQGNGKGRWAFRRRPPRPSSWSS